MKDFALKCARIKGSTNVDAHAKGTVLSPNRHADPS